MEKERNLYTIIFRCFLILIGAFLILDAIVTSRLGSINLGTIMPFVIGLPLLILGVLYNPITDVWNKYLIGRLIKWGMIVCYALFSLLFLTTTILIRLAADAPVPKKLDAMIVLGAGIIGERPSRTLAYRLDKAIEVFNNGNEDTVIIVSGGMGRDEKCSEAHVMKNYLIANGIPEGNILEEDKSTSTEENFSFSKALIDERLGTDVSICFVTTEFHVFRAKALAKGLGIDAEGIAAPDYAPLSLNNYFRECAAIVQHFLRGRLQF